MPLNLGALQSGIANVAAAPPATAAECAQAWAQAVTAYAAGIVPLSGAVASAEATLASGLSSAFGSPAAAPGMETAFSAWAASVGAGMAGFVSVPPPAPVGFAALFAAGHPPTHAAAAANVAAAIDTWARTGTATLVAPPNTLAPWS